MRHRGDGCIGQVPGTSSHLPSRTKSYLPKKTLDFIQNLQHDPPYQSIQSPYVTQIGRD